MISALFVGPALLLGGVLIASGVLKLRGPADLDEFSRLGVPAALQKQWVARLHPWGELALGIVLLVTGGWAGVIAAIIATALMGTYLVLVFRTLRATPDASCACFGSTKRITAVTVVRNAWLTLLGVAAVATMWALPLLGGSLAALGPAGWAWVAVLLAAAITVLLVMWPEPSEAVSVNAQEPIAVASDGELDYIRSLTPAIPVTLADGSTQTLRELSSLRPMLLLAVSSTCGSCTSTISSRERWRELLPEVDIRLILTAQPDDTPIAETAHPMSLHDPQRLVAQSLGYAATPSAVLFGMDGMLAGGPVSGPDGVLEFIGDVYESLHGERPQF
ncbi:MauE/DoxX family redox-associated membrane protein [Microbacterium sp. H1-D42]|uniref:MauE/DoxX family redox-associated membrane protein n=1 Tax=Microbacterium sp. H1-D42 TaxID=2925844 RepID=UPI001F53E1F0|nr:MauE/DoxX family redox-associated membrane protein [Microbacterium sp. H1-D42]UNK70136.1 hypothetical protein MNR00_13325 [Microbacterium sp. H1-D42]